jgi:hypothetical protein
LGTIGAGSWTGGRGKTDGKKRLAEKASVMYIISVMTEMSNNVK